MQRKIEYRGKSGGQIICSNKLSGLTSCKTASVLLTDATLLREVSILASSQMGIKEKLGNDASAQLEILESKLNEVQQASGRIADAIATIGDGLPEFTKKAQELSQQRKNITISIELLNQKIATSSVDLIDDLYAREVHKILYKKSDLARSMRADCNSRLRRAIERIWLWAYDVALVKYKNDVVIHVVVLPLKSKNDKHQYFVSALAGTLKPPGLV